MALHTKLAISDPYFQQRDYMLPAPAKGRSGFLKKPCPRRVATRLLQDGLVFGGYDPAQAKQLTVASLRVFAPNAAFVEGLPEASRAVLGNWANSKTADVYVRDHAKVVNGIWDRLITAYQDQSSEVVGPTQVNFNIHGSEYFMGGEPCDRLVAAMAKRRRTDADNKRNFLDTDTEDWGPLRLIANLKRAVSKAHLVDVYGTCIGCVWKPNKFGNCNKHL